MNAATPSRFPAAGVTDPDLAHLYRTRMPHPVARAYHHWENAAPGTHHELHAAFGFYESLLWTTTLVSLAEHLSRLPDDATRLAELGRADKLALWLRKPTLATLQAALGYCAAHLPRAAAGHRQAAALRAATFDAYADFVATLETEAASLRSSRNSLYHGQFLNLEPQAILPQLREDLTQVAAAARWLGEHRTVARLRRVGTELQVTPFVGVTGENRPVALDANRATWDHRPNADLCVAIDEAGQLISLAPFVHAAHDRWRLAWEMAGARRWRYVDYRDGSQSLAAEAEDLVELTGLPVRLGHLDATLEELVLTPRDAARNPVWQTRYLVEPTSFGHGGQGELFRARDRLLDRPCVVKRIRQAAETGLASPDKFFREAQLLARVRSPHVVAVYDVVVDQCHLPAMILERVPGVTLEEFVRRAESGKLEPAVADDLFRQICTAVQAMHAVDVVHRDLSPTNVMVVTDADLDGEDERKRWAAFAKPHAVVIDFGLARRVSPEASTRPQGAGQRYYTAPEVLHGDDVPAELRPRSDVFSLAKIMNYLLTGRGGKWRGDAVREAWYRNATEEEVEARTPSVAELLRIMPATPAHLIAQGVAATPPGQPGSQRVDRAAAAEASRTSEASVVNVLHAAAAVGPGRNAQSSPGGAKLIDSAAWSVRTGWSVHRLAACGTVVAAIPSPSIGTATALVAHINTAASAAPAQVKSKPVDLGESLAAIAVAPAGVLYGCGPSGAVLRSGAPYSQREIVLRCPPFTTHIACGKAWGDQWLASHALESGRSKLLLARLPVAPHELPRPTQWPADQTIARMGFADDCLHLLTTTGRWWMLPLEGAWGQTTPRVKVNPTVSGVRAVALAGDCKAIVVATDDQIVLTAPGLGLHHHALVAPATRRLAIVPDASPDGGTPRLVSVDKQGNIWLWRTRSPMPEGLGLAQEITALAVTRDWAVVGTAGGVVGFRIP